MKPLLAVGKHLPSLKDFFFGAENLALYMKYLTVISVTLYRQRKKNLKFCLPNHQRAIRYQPPEKSTFCEHSMSLNYHIDRTEASILKMERNYSKRFFIESWLINETPQIFDRNDRQDFPPMYKKLLAPRWV